MLTGDHVEREEERPGPEGRGSSGGTARPILSLVRIPRPRRGLSQFHGDGVLPSTNRPLSSTIVSIRTTIPTIRIVMS